MRRVFRGLSIGVITLIATHAAHAEIKKVRVTNFLNPRDYTALPNILNAQLGTTFTMADFAIGEQVRLRNMRYLHLMQMRAGVPVDGASMRVWLGPDQAMIVMEAFVDKLSEKSKGLRASLLPFLKSAYLSDTAKIAQQETEIRKLLATHADPVNGGFTHQDVWKGEDLQRVFKAYGKRGTHEVRYSHPKNQIVAHTYTPFMNGELPEMQATGFKVYEENDYDISLKMDPETLTLKYLNDTTVASAEDQYLPLTGQAWPQKTNEEALLGITGKTDGATWSYAKLATLAGELEGKLVKRPNGVDAPGGLVMDGRYVNVTVHPDVRATLKDFDFPWLYADFFSMGRTLVDKGPALKITTAYRGASFKTPEALMATPVRDPKHDVGTYLKQGADEVQVYWSVTEMMEQLHRLGFTDPEVSTRKFTAILYNPDPSAKDNAFYINDTLNFTTYSANQPNFARDNTTIWHELGHGIVDRIMGNVETIRGGGFHEGIADFFAELIIDATSFQRDFPGKAKQRIYNNTPFNFSNESHDDGEAFGGFMKSILDGAISLWGEDGVKKTGDLLLEAMRFSRRHPSMDEVEWVEKLRFADSRATAARQANEMSALIDLALKGRNFGATETERAAATVKVDNVVVGTTFGSQKDDLVMGLLGYPRDMKLKVELKDGRDYKFTYPLQVKLEFSAGIFGAIVWAGGIPAPKEITVLSADQVIEFPIGFTGECVNKLALNGCGQVGVVKVTNVGEKDPIVRKYLKFGVYSLASLRLGGTMPVLINDNPIRGVR